jgi:hypothetical protein
MFTPKEMFDRYVEDFNKNLSTLFNRKAKAELTELPSGMGLDTSYMIKIYKDSPYGEFCPGYVCFGNFPGNCGAQIIYNYRKSTTYENEIDSLILHFVEKILYESGYRKLLASTSNGERLFQKRLLEENGWKKLDANFVNFKTSNTITFWHKDL